MESVVFELLIKKEINYFYFYIFETIHLLFCSTICHFIILIGLVSRVFSNGSGDLGSIPGRVIPKTLKMVLDTSLLNTQQYMVQIEGKMEQSRERSSALLNTLV